MSIEDIVVNELLEKTRKKIFPTVEEMWVEKEFGIERVIQHDRKTGEIKVGKVQAYRSRNNVVVSVTNCSNCNININI